MVLAVALLAPGTGSAAAASGCAGTSAHREVAPVVSYDPQPSAPRVFAMQFQQDPRNVVTYSTFKRKVDCLLRADVVPRLAHGRPNLVVFTEDIGLMTGATGTRGATARALWSKGGDASGCAGMPSPCQALAGLSALGDAYAPQVAAYHQRFPDLPPLADDFVAATDTFARGWMTTFSVLARKYRIYVVGSGTPGALPQDDRPGRGRRSSPTPTCRTRPSPTWPQARRSTTRSSSGARAGRSCATSNRKVPITPIEQALSVTPGPSTGAEAVANLRPFRLPGTRARLGFATSLPAFTYGDPPAGTDPCSDTSLYYMRCLDKLGANLVVQDEANPGAWTGPDGDGVEQWQPLSWMTSTWRAVTDPSVRFAYDVTPMLTGNLGDIAFDGQSAITQRGLRGRGCHYIGNARWIAGEDRPDLRDEAGPKPQFLALAPWVAPDGPRGRLRAVGSRLQFGSGSALEDDYVETALVADLPFPPDPRRPNCLTTRGSAH